MSSLGYAGAPGASGGGATSLVGKAGPDAEARASRRWRTLWRTHFYAGLFAAPVLVMFAITGLVILYAQPIQDVLQGDLRTVSASGKWRSFDAQQRAVERAYPDATVTAVVVPRNATTSTQFGLDGGRAVFVNPYTNEVLGSTDPAGGIVGLSNRLHGFLNNDSLTVRLPALAGVLGQGPILQEFVVGDVILEIFACWAVVLVLSGLYLWWPRRSRASGGRVRKSVLVPRLGKRGRARWRDLHAIPGMLAAAGTLFVLVSGLFWSSYWGTNFSAVADRITPNAWVDAPDSGQVTRGDLDRLGNRINWNTEDAVVPNTKGTGIDPMSLPARASLDTIVAIAGREQMKPGYTIVFPEDGTDDAGNPTFGSFALENSWPRKTSEARTVYLEQFTGETISTMDVYGYGTVSRVADTLVSTHMGTELGVFSRILMTLLCVAIIWSVVSAIVMYAKRRRPGGTGLPRRPADVSLATGLIVLMIVIGVVFPLWGVTALLVLGFDRFVVRRIPTLRVAFGQR